MKQTILLDPDTPWEHGSEFFWFVHDQEEAENIIPPSSVLFTSGRAATYAMLLKGQKELGWKRLHVPAYYDYDVIKIVKKSGIEFSIYEDYPFEAPSSPPEVKKGDVILIYNTFGMRSKEQYKAYYDLNVPVIEDHSHDPWCSWCRDSDADYVLLTLRKTLPVPDGGTIWSPKNSPLPSAPSQEKGSSPAAQKKLQAMLLKSLYLKFGKPSKEDYLTLTGEGEDSFEVDLDYPISPISKAVSNNFPWKRWRKERKDNFNILRDLCSDIGEIEIMEPACSDACPFIMLTLFSTHEARELVRKYLHQHSVYATVIWPFTEKIDHWPDSKAADYSERILVFHHDARYDRADLEQTANIFRDAVNQLHFKRFSVPKKD